MFHNMTQNKPQESDIWGDSEFVGNIVVDQTNKTNLSLNEILDNIAGAHEKPIVRKPTVQIVEKQEACKKPVENKQKPPPKPQPKKIQKKYDDDDEYYDKYEDYTHKFNRKGERW